MDHLQTFFKYDIGPVLNYSALEAQLGLYNKTLRHWVKSGRGLSDSVREKVEQWARAHGYNERQQYDPIV